MRSLWGIGPTRGPIHFGYDVAALEQQKLIDEGYDHTILIADLHAMMTNGFTFDEARRRAQYCEAVFSTCYGLECRYVRGSDFQLSWDYVTLLFGLASKLNLKKSMDTFSRATQEGAQASGEKVAAVLYPIMQCLDAPFLRADLLSADTGQKRIYDLIKPNSEIAQQIQGLVNVRDTAPLEMPQEIRYHTLLVDTKGKRLNNSTSDTRISIHEAPQQLAKKVRGMYAPLPGQPLADGCVANAVLAYAEASVFPWVDLPVTIETHGGPVVCDDYAELERHYADGVVHPGDIKNLLVEVLSERVRKFRNQLADASYNWLDRSKM